MFLQDIENELPNGFHDSVLLGIQIDFLQKKALLRMNIWVGDSISEDESRREEYLLVDIQLKEVSYFIIEPPKRISNEPEKELLVDGGSSYEKLNTSCPYHCLESTGQDGGAYWFYVHQWNSFIHLAARDAKILDLSESLDA